jgi:hypothetical protein
MPRGMVVIPLAAAGVTVPALAPLAPNWAVLVAMAVAAGAAAGLAAYLALPSSRPKAPPVVSTSSALKKMPQTSRIIL